MGKLQIKRGITVPTQLAAGEPFFDGTDLHIGKLSGTGGNQKIGSAETGATIKTKLEALTGEERLDAAAIKNLPEGGSGGGTTTIVEWVAGEPKPTLAVDKMAGDFIEGKTHCVTVLTTEETAIAIVNVVGDNASFIASIVDDNVNSAIVNSDGTILIAGYFSGYLKKLNADGSEITAFASNMPSFDGTINSIAINSDGTILVGGQFSGYLKKLNADGSEITAFASNLPTFDDYVNCIAVNSDGTILVDGEFSGWVKKLNADGSEITAFASNLPTFDDSINSIAINSDGTILVGGFSGYLKKLNADGSEITAFASNLPTFDDYVNCFAVNSDGTILVGGSFSGWLKKLNADGSEITAFASNMPSFDDSIKSIAINSDGTILIAGFSGWLKKLNADGSEITAFASNLPTFDDSINSIAINSDGTILVGGSFSGWLKKLNADGSEITAYADYILTLLNTMQRINRASPAPISGVINSAGIHYVISDQTPIVVLQKGTMQAGDMITIYNIGTQGLMINAELSNFTIGQELTAKNYAQFCVREDRGELVLAFMYSSSYIGPNL